MDVSKKIILSVLLFTAYKPTYALDMDSVGQGLLGVTTAMLLCEAYYLLKEARKVEVQQAKIKGLVSENARLLKERDALKKALEDAHAKLAQKEHEPAQQDVPEQTGHQTEDLPESNNKSTRERSARWDRSSFWESI